MGVLRLLAIMCALLGATESFAVFDVQALVGYGRTRYTLDFERLNTETDNTYGGLVGTVSAHVNYKQIPIALGLTFDYTTQDMTNSSDTTLGEDLSGYELGAEIYAWLPIGKMSSIYFKFGYVFMGQYQLGFDVFDVDYVPEGLLVHGGFKIGFTNNVGLLIEGGVPSTGITEAKRDGEDLKVKKEFKKVTRWDVKVGLQYGI